jgi:hypothetical protein
MWFTTFTPARQERVTADNTAADLANANSVFRKLRKSYTTRSYTILLKCCLN